MFVAGIKADSVRTSAQGPEVAVGTLGFSITTAGPKGYIYTQAGSGGVTGDGYVCLIDGSSYMVDLCTDTLSAPGVGQGKPIGIGRAAIAANGYGWLQVYGPGTVRVLALAALYTQLTTSATAGALDDATTVGLEVVDGIVLDATNGGSTANVAAWLNWPRVGRTL